MTSVVALTELLTLNTDGAPVSSSNPLPVAPDNITGKFRETFETFTPGVNWNLVTGTGDIVQVDGNAVSASYLVISKNPLTAGTETALTYTGSFPMPIETAVGLSLSQRVLGQELSMEVVSTETPVPQPTDTAIASIVQATTTLTVTTATAHGLTPGMRIGIVGVTSDSRLNYPSLVVATITSATVFTCTAGPGGTITSLSVGPYTNQGTVYYRSAMGGAQNGVSEIFENASATNASAYSRSAAGDVLPSATLAGNQSLTVATTTPTQAINSAYTYAFLPASEYRINLQADRTIVYDAAIDTTSATSSRQYRTQVIPDPTKQYTLRFRVTNNKGLTVPNAKIVSASKAGTTTATITTATAHGLTTGDFVTTYGIRNGTDFPPGVTTQVVSTPTSTTFTIVMTATTPTTTSYGGFVARVNGGNNPASFNMGGGGAVQTATVANNELTLTSPANWTFTIGDYANVYGVRDNSTGADLGVDGVYRVANQSTTTLVLEPIAGTVLPAPFGSTSCGGAAIKRTDVRISFVRIFEYLRERVEMLAQPTQAAAAPVFLAGGTLGSGFVTPISSNAYALLTSTNLGSSATYTGSSTNAASSTTSAIVYFTAINVSVLHTAGLTPGTLIFEVGSETSSTAPTTWFGQFVVPIPSNSNWQTFTFPLTTRYYRLRFVNGATAQTVFRLTTMSIYNGALGNALTFPDYLLFPLSTTALAGGATFTGATLDFGDTNRLYRSLTATAFADQASGTDGFVIQVSRDGTTWRTAKTATVTANTLTTITAELVYRYARVVYTNGATLQGAFNLDCQAGV